MQFVVQMYASKYYTKEHMIVYECQPNERKDNWHKTFKYFTNLYALRKSYYKYQAGKRSFESATSVKEATTGPQTTYTGSITIPTGANSVNTTLENTSE